MKILLRLPNWLGDGVMFSPIFEVLKKQYVDADFILVGPSVVCDLYAKDARVKQIFIDRSKQSKNRLFATYRLAKEIGSCDIAITFTNHIFSALLLFFTKSKMTIGFGGFLRNVFLSHIVVKQSSAHQVLCYAQLLKPLNFAFELGGLKLITEDLKKDTNKICIGISTGAAFGASKIWLKEYFAEVVSFLLQQGYRVFLFGSGNEALNNEEIFQIVKKQCDEENLQNLQDLSNKTSIAQLVNKIGSLDLFLSNDSGPMHIAAALNVPLVALFGATHPTFCLPWHYKKCVIINKHLDCSPCQKKICPLRHHQCMKQITPQEVIDAMLKLLKKEEYAN